MTKRCTVASDLDRTRIERSAADGRPVNRGTFAHREAWSCDCPRVGGTSRRGNVASYASSDGASLFLREQAQHPASVVAAVFLLVANEDEEHGGFR